MTVRLQFAQTQSLMHMPEQLTHIGHLSRNVRKQTMWILTRSDTNQAVQLLKRASGLGSRGIVLSK